MKEMSLHPIGALRMVRRNGAVFMKTWKVNFLPPILEQVMYLLAIGFGLGFLIDEIEGVSYAKFIAPALIANTVMQTAFFETTYSSFIRMTFQKTWDAVVATPLSHKDILAGEMIWAALRATINASIMTLVSGAFGLLDWSYVWMVPILAFTGGLIFAAIGLIVTSKVKSIDQFSYAMYLFITPMYLFAGTFFPLKQLPDVILPIAAVLPLTHVVSLIRNALAGIETFNPLWSVLYLTVGAIMLPILAMRIGEKRIRQ